MSLITPLDSRGRRAGIRIKRPGDRRSSSRSATRAIDVLELMGVSRRPLRAVEIAQALAMHPSTTNQLLKTMVDSAHLLFDARAMTYMPSPRLTGFSSWIVSLYGSEDRLRSLVRDLRAATGKIVTLSTANDLFMQILEVSCPSGVIAERGQRISLFGSAIGSAFLSMLDAAEVVRLAHRARIPKSEFETIAREIEAIRQEGYAYGPSQFEGRQDSVPAWSIAMPLPGATMPVGLVLGIAGLAGEPAFEATVLAELMHDAIKRSKLLT